MKYNHVWSSWVVWTLAVPVVMSCESRPVPPAESATSVAATWGHDTTRATSVLSASSTSASTFVRSPDHDAIHPTPTPRTRMAFHAQEAEAMRKALISGDRTKALNEASNLSADTWTPHLKPSWRDHMSPMYVAAKEFVDATTSRGAAAAIGHLGLACANCHRVLGGPDPQLSMGVAPRPSMEAHAWAVERLWFGLMAPSETAWLEGATHLSDSPIVGSDVTVIDAEAQKLQGLARVAIGTKGEQRGELFGDIMNTCASCHRRVGRER